MLHIGRFTVMAMGSQKLPVAHMASKKIVSSFGVEQGGSSRIKESGSSRARKPAALFFSMDGVTVLSHLH